MLSPLAFWLQLRALAWRKSFCIGSGNCPVTVQVMKNLRFGCSSDCARKLYNSSGRRREPRTRISTAPGGQQRRRKMWLQLVYGCVLSLSDGETVFAHACKLDLEGIVSKREDSTRTRHMVGYCSSGTIEYPDRRFPR